MGLFLLYCVTQRRRGRRERMAADAAYEKETSELMQFRNDGGKGWERL